MGNVRSEEVAVGGHTNCRVKVLRKTISPGRRDPLYSSQDERVDFVAVGNEKVMKRERRQFDTAC